MKLHPSTPLLVLAAVLFQGHAAPALFAAPAEKLSPDAALRQEADQEDDHSDDTTPPPDYKIPAGGPYELKNAGGTFLREPYLQCATPTSIHIVWRTLKPLSQPQVRYGSLSGFPNQTVEGSAITLRRLEAEGDSDNPLWSAPAGTHQYEAHITGLQPDTRYFYGIYDGSRQLTPGDESFRFRTLPEPGTARDCTFWVVGDSGTGRRMPRTVHRAAIDWMKQQGIELDLYTHVGDMAYNDGKDREFTDTFFDVYEDTLRHVTCFPAFGNHEGHSSNGNAGIGPYFDAYICPTEGQSGGEPSGTEAYYSYDFGRAHFIVLNSHDADRRTSAAMATWLRQDLDKLDPARTDWVMAYWHHPPYTKGSHDSDKELQLIEMRKYIIPILESGGVDLVFTGHSHIYERSMLVDGAHATPTTALRDPVSGKHVILDDGDGHKDRDGAYRKSEGLPANQGSIQIVAGHGGTKNSAKYGGLSPIMRTVSLLHGSVVVQIKGRTLDAKMISYQGKEIDNFQIIKEGKITPKRLENPRLMTPASLGVALPEREPARLEPVIPDDARWAYLAGRDPSGGGWTGLDFNDSDWKRGTMAIGYGEEGLQTELRDMRKNYTRVYLRTEFQLEDLGQADRLGLLMSYDDGFIAYINGREILRENVSFGQGAEVDDVRRTDDPQEAYYSLAGVSGFLRQGRNVLAIEGHNERPESSDFLLAPRLVRRAD